MPYKLYIEVKGALKFVSEEAFLIDIKNDMLYMEERLRNEYDLGVVHFLVFKHTELIMNTYRYMGVEI